MSQTPELSASSPNAAGPWQGPEVVESRGVEPLADRPPETGATDPSTGGGAEGQGRGQEGSLALIRSIARLAAEMLRSACRFTSLGRDPSWNQLPELRSASAALDSLALVSDPHAFVDRPCGVAFAPAIERELTYDERRSWGTCPYCDRKHGEPCNPDIGFSFGGGRRSDGVHLGRLNEAPFRIRIVASR